MASSSGCDVGLEDPRDWMVELGTGLQHWGLGKSGRGSFAVLKEHHLKSVNVRGLVRRESEFEVVAVGSS